MTPVVELSVRQGFDHLCPDVAAIIGMVSSGRCSRPGGTSLPPRPKIRYHRSRESESLVRLASSRSSCALRAGCAWRATLLTQEGPFQASGIGVANRERGLKRRHTHL